MPDPLARVGLTLFPELRWVLVGLAARLKQRHGSQVHLYCPTAEDVAFHRGKDREGVFASIGSARRPEQALPVGGVDEAAEARSARAWEDRLGVTINRLAMANRHLGRGYALAGPGHPRSRPSEASYGAMLAAYNATLESWDREITEKEPTLVVNGRIELARLAATRGIPCRFLSSSRWANLYHWAIDERLACPAIEARFRAIEAGPEVTVEAPYALDRTSRADFHAAITRRAVARDALATVLRHGWGRLRGHEKARAGYHLGDQVRLLARRRADWRRLLRVAAPLASLEGQVFVFYALQEEPEISMGQISPEFFFQLAAIASLGRDLPAGVLLAVKETVHAVGRRPRDFYDQIRALKNVVLLDPREGGIAARAVATVTGTVGLEAAVMGRPVVAFGSHNLYDVLGHVHVPGSLADLRPILDRALDPDFDGAAARAEAARFIAALRAVSFDLGDYDFKHLKRNVEPAAEAAYQGLVVSLEQHPIGLDRQGRSADRVKLL
ncbi:MAG: hypothetical protein WD673_12065 [Alphaproteobacteria bacterium]